MRLVGLLLLGAAAYAALNVSSLGLLVGLGGGLFSLALGAAFLSAR